MNVFFVIYHRKKSLKTLDKSRKVCYNNILHYNR